MDMERINADAVKYRTKFAVDSAVDEWREQHQAEEQAEYENMGVLDRINDTISRTIDTDAIRNAMGETYKNGYDMNPTTPRPFGAVQDIWQDMMDASERTRAAREVYAREWKNMHDKRMNGQVTPEDEENFRNADSNVKRAYADMAASPFRQAARNFIKNNSADNNSFFQGTAQSLQQTDVNLEYFMTPAEKLQKSREIEQDLGIPAGSMLASNDAYREALEMYNFKQKSDNIEEVWEKYPELQRMADMDPEGAAVALHDMQTVKNTRGVVDTFMTFLEKGNTELEYNNLQYKIMMGRATDEEVKRAEDLKARVEEGNKLEAPGFFQSPLASMAAGVAGSLPEMGQSLVEGAEGGGAAGAALTVGAVALTIATGGTDLLAAGGVAAMRAAIMRALSSEAGRKLLKTGLYSGLIHGMGAPESGRNYAEMKDMKKPDGTQLYTDEEARNWSLLRGYTNAAIEVANFGMAAKAVYPVANRVFAQSVEQITRETLGRETLKDFARGRVGDWLKLTATESAEEAAQSAADDVISNVALSTKSEDAAQYKQYSIMDIATRAGQAFIESLPASMGFATIGAGVGTITGAGRMARARKRAADMERNYGKQQTQTYMGVMAVEQLQKAVEQGNLDKVAPDVQKKVLKEQLAGTEFSRAYIDVEMAMQKENGREDLQKVAEAAGMSADELEAAITVNGYIPVGTETLAQAKVSPDLLDSVSFSEDADSMARMRENGKTIIEDYKKNFDKMVKRQEKLADAIIENNMKNASAEQKAILRQVMLSNISNPAQAWNDLRKMYNDELQEKIAPALEALKRGMGNAELMETQDEQGNTKTVRYTENDEWYRNFYKTFKRKPTKAELEDMAIAMVTEDSNAPKVAGWIPDSAEAQAEFEKNRPVIEQLKNNIAQLDSVKEEAKKLTGVEMELTQGLTPEAFKVYRAIFGWTNKAGGKIARAGRISAILVARHADLYAEAIRKNTGKNYTAEDYIRERLGFQLVQAGIDRDGVLKQLDVLLQRAWHGTPHDFEKFDLGAIGTGEGLQVHGWGLYFAQNRRISEERYKKRLSKLKRKEIIYRINNKEVIINPDENYQYDNPDPTKGFEPNPKVNAEKQAALLLYKGKTKKEILESIDWERDQTNNYYDDNPEEWSKGNLQYLNELEKIIKESKIEHLKSKEKKGKLFKVEIPNNDVLLDEQKSFTEQPLKVKKAVLEILYQEEIEKNKFLVNDYKYGYYQYDKMEKLVLSNTEKLEKAIKDMGLGYQGEKIINLIKEGNKSKAIQEIRKNKSFELAQQKKFEKAVTKEEILKEILNKTGKELYRAIDLNPRIASEKLNAAGVKGITYNGGTDGRCFVIFDDKSIDIIEKYNQQVNGSQDGQGWIDIKPGPDGRRIVHILETADESTFMHEMAHAFLFDLEDLAQSDKTYAKELEIVNQWAEWKKGDYKEYKRTEWADEFAQREQAIIDAEENHDYERAEKLKAEWRQERFARGFEMYLREGNAPAPGLKAVFRLFKQFLSAIYKAFTGDGGKPSVQVRRVMDRMIASEDEIEVAALQDRYSDVVKAGGEKLFNEREEDTMKRWAKEEREAAKEKVLKLVMRDLEKEKQLEYNNRMAEERERYQKELAQENIFLARNLITETKDKESVTMWFDSVEEFEAMDKVTPDMETLVNQHMQEYGQQLDKSLMESHLSQEAIDKAMDSSKYRVKLEKYILKGMERKKNLVNSINAKARAAMTSIEEKLNALPKDVDLQLEKNDNPTIKDIVKEITKLRFAGKWSTQDINHIEAMLRASTQEEARKALKEFKDRQKQQKQNMQDIEEATKGMEKLYRDMIKQTTADRPMSETCNIKYYKDKERNTERRVQQMAKAQNWEMAIHQQRQKVFYSMMVKQARENRDTRDKMIKDLQRKLNARTVKIPKDERYWFNRILYIMKLNPTNPKMPEGGVTSLDNIFKEQQEALENIYVPDQLIQIRDAGENFGDYNKMNLNDFREAYEDLVRLYELGRDKFNFKSIGGKSFEDVAQEIISDPDKLPGMMALTRKVGPNQGGIGYIDALGNLGQAGHDVAKYIQQYHNSSLKPENILEMLGPKAQKYIYGLLEKAAEKEAILAEKNLRAIQDINAIFTREEHQEWTEQKYDFPGTKGWKITKENILMMAINYGSEKNRQRLIGGLIEDGRKKDKMSAQQVQEAIEDLFIKIMTAKDWEFVQRLWDHIGSYWHETAAVEEKLNGIALGKVEPLPFSIQTADGKIANLKGGYMHIKYDFEKSARAEENEINDRAMSISAGARRLGVGRGMVKARTEHNVYMEVVLNFDVINQHLQDVIHNIAYRIPVRDIYRLLHYKNDSAGLTMETYIKESLGAEAFRVLDAWAMDAWRQVSDNRNSAEGSMNKAARYLRTNATMAIMGFRMKPVVENLGNLPIAMNQIGSMKMLNALFGFYGNREENYREVIARSAFMRTRAENLDRDLKSQPGVFRQGNKLLETAKEHAYDMLVITDLAVSAPMWWQVYHESIKPKMKEVQKENEENMQKRIDLANKADSIRAEIAGHFQGAADIDEHLKIRRYGTPAEIEALRQTEFAGISEGELRAQWGQHQNEIRNLRKELFKIEQEQEKANQLPVYTNAEIQEEAIQRAVFAADKVVRDTIGSGRVIDQSAVQRSTNEFVRLFTAFYSFFNAQWNLIYMAYAKSKYAPEGTGSIEKWAPLAKTLMFNVFLSALITTAVGFAFGLKGDSDDEKFETITNAEGKKEKVEKPWLERFLRSYAKESLSISTGGLYGVRDIVQLLGDYAFSGQNFGYKMGSVATRGLSETLRAGDMLIRKGEKDAEIQEREEKQLKTHEEKLKKLKGKKRREYLQKWEEEQKYRKPPKRITYEEILSHGVTGLTTLTAARTGLTTTLTDAITHTMMYMMDKDMRYDPSWKNIIWSAIFDKKPVEREIPKKPQQEETNKNKKKRKQSER
ncbi:MAG: hypothetical protein IJI45_11330 [Anaerolineaceae bacterium]|nr:hypothetical protein [Anaerolineaceae bacterium]